MTKNELRKLYLEKRKGLNQSEYDRYNQQITDLFFQVIDFSHIQTLHIYLPIAVNHEPDTWHIIERLQLEMPHIHLVVPKVNGEEMKHVYFEDRSQLETHKWGIPEPKKGKEVSVNKIDLVIVPLLVVDKNGHRIGYGKGFYDRFLKQCRPDCIKVGLSFFEPVPCIEETHSHDVPLNICITPNHAHTFMD